MKTFKLESDLINNIIINLTPRSNHKKTTISFVDLYESLSIADFIIKLTNTLNLILRDHLKTKINFIINPTSELEDKLKNNKIDQLKRNKHYKKQITKAITKTSNNRNNNISKKKKVKRKENLLKKLKLEKEENNFHFVFISEKCLLNDIIIENSLPDVGCLSICLFINPGLNSYSGDDGSCRESFIIGELVRNYRGVRIIIVSNLIFNSLSFKIDLLKNELFDFVNWERLRYAFSVDDSGSENGNNCKYKNDGSCGKFCFSGKENSYYNSNDCYNSNDYDYNYENDNENIGISNLNYITPIKVNKNPDNMKTNNKLSNSRRNINKSNKSNISDKYSKSHKSIYNQTNVKHKYVDELNKTNIMKQHKEFKSSKLQIDFNQLKSNINRSYITENYENKRIRDCKEVRNYYNNNNDGYSNNIYLFKIDFYTTLSTQIQIEIKNKLTRLYQLALEELISNYNNINNNIDRNNRNLFSLLSLDRLLLYNKSQIQFLLSYFTSICIVNNSPQDYLLRVNFTDLCQISYLIINIEWITSINIYYYYLNAIVQSKENSIFKISTRNVDDISESMIKELKKESFSILLNKEAFDNIKLSISKKQNNVNNNSNNNISSIGIKGSGDISKSNYKNDIRDIDSNTNNDTKDDTKIRNILNNIFSSKDNNSNNNNNNNNNNNDHFTTQLNRIINEFEYNSLDKELIKLNETFKYILPFFQLDIKLDNYLNTEIQLFKCLDKLILHDNDNHISYNYNNIANVNKSNSSMRLISYNKEKEAISKSTSKILSSWNKFDRIKNQFNSYVKNHANTENSNINNYSNSKFLSFKTIDNNFSVNKNKRVSVDDDNVRYGNYSNKDNDVCNNKRLSIFDYDFSSNSNHINNINILNNNSELFQTRKSIFQTKKINNNNEASVHNESAQNNYNNSMEIHQTPKFENKTNVSNKRNTEHTILIIVSNEKIKQRILNILKCKYKDSNINNLKYDILLLMSHLKHKREYIQSKNEYITYNNIQSNNSKYNIELNNDLTIIDDNKEQEDNKDDKYCYVNYNINIYNKSYFNYSGDNNFGIDIKNHLIPFKPHENKNMNKLLIDYIKSIINSNETKANNKESNNDSKNKRYYYYKHHSQLDKYIETCLIYKQGRELINNILINHQDLLYSILIEKIEKQMEFYIEDIDYNDLAQYIFLNVEDEIEFLKKNYNMTKYSENTNSYQAIKIKVKESNRESELVNNISYLLKNNNDLNSFEKEIEDSIRRLEKEITKNISEIKNNHSSYIEYTQSLYSLIESCFYTIYNKNTSDIRDHNDHSGDDSISHTNISHLLQTKLSFKSKKKIDIIVYDNNINTIRLIDYEIRNFLINNEKIMSDKMKKISLIKNKLDTENVIINKEISDLIEKIEKTIIEINSFLLKDFLIDKINVIVNEESFSDVRNDNILLLEESMEEKIKEIIENLSLNIYEHCNTSDNSNRSMKDNNNHDSSIVKAINTIKKRFSNSKTPINLNLDIKLESQQSPRSQQYNEIEEIKPYQQQVYSSTDNRLILFDSREMSCEVPYQLSKYLKVHSEFLKVGDYILNNEIVIERKSVITKDLYESLKNGRLLSQVKQMLKFYKRSVIIIELSLNCFGRALFLYKTTYKKVIDLIFFSEFKLSVYFSYNENHSARIMNCFKGNSILDVERCKKLGVIENKKKGKRKNENESNNISYINDNSMIYLDKDCMKDKNNNDKDIFGGNSQLSNINSNTRAKEEKRNGDNEKFVDYDINEIKKINKVKKVIIKILLNIPGISNSNIMNDPLTISIMKSILNNYFSLKDFFSTTKEKLALIIKNKLQADRIYDYINNIILNKN